MADFLLELFSEEIPARMQPAAARQLGERFAALLQEAGLAADAVETHATPRRLALLARGLPATSAAVREEKRGPRVDAPEKAIDGFLKSTGLSRTELEERDDPKGRFLYAVIDRPGRALADVLAERLPVMIEGFQWPKSQRWGDASASTASPRWVRPLRGIVALVDSDVVPFTALGINSGRETFGHRFMGPSEPVSIESPASYAAQLRAAQVIVSAEERMEIIRTGAEAAAAAAGLTLIPDAGLEAENAGLTEWPVPLLGRYDPAFLNVPREIIQLTMRTNQKYFAVNDAAGELAPAFVCVANLAASDGGATIVAGNERVLSARLADARFFWEQDLKVPLAEQAKKLGGIVFHEKLGTMADKVARVARLARWLAENHFPDADPDIVERAARLAKADLVTGTVGEFPELQGVIGGYLAHAQGEAVEVVAALLQHYAPLPNGDVPVIVALADRIDTLAGFFDVGIRPTGSKDPFALRRAALGVIQIILDNTIHCKISDIFSEVKREGFRQFIQNPDLMKVVPEIPLGSFYKEEIGPDGEKYFIIYDENGNRIYRDKISPRPAFDNDSKKIISKKAASDLMAFLIDRLKVQQREAGVRHDLIDAVFALGDEDDLVRLLARVKALQAFVETDDGANLLAGYKRAANILRIEEKKDGVAHGPAVDPQLLRELAEQRLASALADTAGEVAQSLGQEDFGAAMTALAALRPSVDAFFNDVTVNADDAALRINRLGLLALLRDTANQIADFTRITG